MEWLTAEDGSILPVLFHADYANGEVFEEVAMSPQAWACWLFAIIQGEPGFRSAPGRPTPPLMRGQAVGSVRSGVPGSAISGDSRHRVCRKYS